MSKYDYIPHFKSVSQKLICTYQVKGNNSYHTAKIISTVVYHNCILAIRLQYSPLLSLNVTSKRITIVMLAGMEQINSVKAFMFEPFSLYISEDISVSGVTIELNLIRNHTFKFHQIRKHYFTYVT
jgi:hypothetical protein